MAKGNFPTCNAFTHKEEGGYSNHPQDKGGKTMSGVTEAVFHAWLRKNGTPIRDVRTITHAETDAIYRQEYWNPANCENLYAGVDLSVYDASVNSGVSRGKKWLLASVGSTDHRITIKRINAARLSFMKSLKIWNTFKNGWSGRVARCEAQSLKMCSLAMGLSTEQTKKDLEKEANKASNTSVAQAGGAVGSGAGTGVDATTISPDQWVSWVLMAVLLALAVFLVVKAVNNSKRANALLDATHG